MTDDHAADHPAGRPHLIATAAELAALAAAVEPDAPVFVGPARVRVTSRKVTLSNRRHFVWPREVVPQRGSGLDW